jgi:hypothetical protein
MANIFVAFEIQMMVLKSKMVCMKIKYAILQNRIFGFGHLNAQKS